MKLFGTKEKKIERDKNVENLKLSFGYIYTKKTIWKLFYILSTILIFLKTFNSKLSINRDIR